MCQFSTNVVQSEHHYRFTNVACSLRDITEKNTHLALNNNHSLTCAINVSFVLVTCTIEKFSKFTNACILRRSSGNDVLSPCHQF